MADGPFVGGGAARRAGEDAGRGRLTEPPLPALADAVADVDGTAAIEAAGWTTDTVASADGEGTAAELDTAATDGGAFAANHALPYAR